MTSGPLGFVNDAIKDWESQYPADPARGGARRFGVAVEKPERCDDDDDECKHRDQIDLSGIVVTVMADFPAH